MTEFTPEQQKVVSILRAMKEGYDSLSTSNSMRQHILEDYEELRDLFAARVARDLINDKLMFKKEYK